MPMKTLHPILIFLLFLFPSALFAAMQEEEIENRPFAMVAQSNSDGCFYAVKAERVYESKVAYLMAERISIVRNRAVANNDSVIWNFIDNNLRCFSDSWLISGYFLGTQSKALELYVKTDSVDISKRWLCLSGTEDQTFRFVENKKKYRVVNNTSSYAQAYLYDIAQGYQRFGLSEGKFGTICLPYNVETAEWSGATFYEIVGKRMQDGKVISLSLRKVSELVAGRPYIFKAENETLAAVYGNKKATSALEHNGLVGSLEDTPVAEGMYLISDNMVKKCGTGCSIAANRAYINMENVPKLPDGTINDVVELQMYGIPTEICMPTISVDAPSLYYNLGGHPIEECSKGIRIGRNGIKELVR